MAPAGAAQLKRDLQPLACALADRIATAVCFADRHGVLIHTNPAAERLLSAGGAVMAIGGRLTGADPRSAERIGEALRRACAPPLGIASYLSVYGQPGNPVQMHFEPVGAHPVHRSPAPEFIAMVMIGTPDLGVHRSAALQAMFGLTRAEARVARGLAQGRTLEQIRRLNGVSITTLRTQLARLYEKTGATNQAQLVAMVRTLPGVEDEPVPAPVVIERR